jgi:hypothetical protein
VERVARRTALADEGSGDRRRHLDDGLIGFYFDERLVKLHCLTRLDEPPNDLSLCYTLTNIG